MTRPRNALEVEQETIAHIDGGADRVALRQRQRLGHPCLDLERTAEDRAPDLARHRDEITRPGTAAHERRTALEQAKHCHIESQAIRDRREISTHDRHLVAPRELKETLEQTLV